MKKKSSDWIFEILISISALWILRRMLENKPTPSIDGITFRKLITYETIEKKKIVAEEIAGFTNQEAGVIVRALIKAKMEHTLSEPFFKRMKHNVQFTGELRPFPFRIFIHKITEEKWLVLHIFKKKKDETDTKEIQIAERRLREYLSR
jgi:phage-related protein